MKQGLFLLFISVLAVGVSGEVRYRVVDLGEVEDGPVFPNAINNKGQIAGEAGYYPNDQACLWEDGKLTLLRKYSPRSCAKGINDHGVIVGEELMPSKMEIRGFIWNNGSISYTGHLGGVITYALAINNKGQITGESGYNPDNPWRTRAFFWEKGVMTDLGTFGGLWSSGLSINESGHVVGVAKLENNESHAFIYDGQQMHDLGGDDDEYTIAWDINDSGVVVGEKEDYACIWVDKEWDFLEGVYSSSNAYAINNKNQVIGTFRWISGEIFLHDNGKVIALNDIIDSDHDIRIYNPVDINDKGQIVARGDVDGESRGLLLNPYNSGDVTGDLRVDMEDFGAFSSAWLSSPADPNMWDAACDLYDPNQTPPYPGYEFDPNDSIIDVKDLEIFTEYWMNR